MAWYYGTFSCGHEGRVDIIGPTKDRQWKADRKFEGLCPECYEKKKEEERLKKNKEAAKESEEMELPKLIGSEKQVAWANTLRLDFIKKLENYIEVLRNTQGKTNKDIDEIRRLLKRMNFTPKNSIEEILDAFCEIETDILKETKASFWIDTRDDFYYTLESHKKNNKEVIWEKDTNALIECSVSPKDKKYAGIVEIRATDSLISAVYEKNDDFRDIVKSLRFKWNGIWERSINELTGSYRDRAAELGNKLLNAGFTISIQDEEIRNMAINGLYEQECDRWIMQKDKDKEKNRIRIYFPKNDELYKKARALPSSKWDGAVTVIATYYKEIEDFAKMFDFKFTKKAGKYIKDIKEKMEKVETVTPKKVVKNKEKDGLKDILESSREILADLRDDD